MSTAVVGFAKYVDPSIVSTYNSKCMDGTPPVYWINTSPTGSKKWLLSLEGGGYCASSWNNCYEYGFQSYVNQGTSNSTILNSRGYTVPTWDFSANLGNYYSQDPNINPMMHDWNIVYMHYCDGGAWTSNLAGNVTYNGTAWLSDSAPEVAVNVPTGTTLHFRGYANKMSILKDLEQNYGLLDATDIVVGGQSAGAFAAYAYLDSISSMYPDKVVVGMPDSGFFLAVNYPSCNYLAQFQWIYDNMNSGSVINGACVQSYTLSGGDPRNCMFAQYLIPYIQTPLFALQSSFDSSQYLYILCLAYSSDPTNETAIYGYSQYFRQVYYASGMGEARKSGFLSNCPRHYYYYNFTELGAGNGVGVWSFDEWNGIGGYDTMGNDYSTAFGAFASQQQAFSQWYTNAYSIGMNFQQSPVNPDATYMDYLYCSNALDATSTSSSDTLGTGAIIGVILACVIGFIFIHYAVIGYVRSQHMKGSFTGTSAGMSSQENL